MKQGADPAQGATALAPGDRVGKYRVRRLVGDGGMGLVYEVEHETLDEVFALKILKPHALGSADAVRRFIVEARASASIRSPHVVRVTDVGTHETLGTPFMVMELLVGQDLADLLAARGKLPIPTAVDYVLQALEAIAEAHALGIVHRDLKPSNLFLARGLDEKESIKVLDFGISKANESISRTPNATTATNQLLGTPAYMSPEQLRSAKHVDQRTDIWAMGVLFFELVTGQTPFNANTMGELFAAVFEDEPPRLRTRLAHAPEALEQVVSRCLERKPDRRFSDVEELASALAPFGTEAAAVSVERIRRVLKKSANPSAPVVPLTTTLATETLALAATAAMPRASDAGLAAAASPVSAPGDDRSRPASVSALVSPARPVTRGTWIAAALGAALVAAGLAVAVAFVSAGRKAPEGLVSSSSVPASLSPIDSSTATATPTPPPTPTATEAPTQSGPATSVVPPVEKRPPRPANSARPVSSAAKQTPSATATATVTAPALLQHDRH